MSDTVNPSSATPDIILRDPDPDPDALTSSIARHSDWLPRAEYEVRGLMLADQAIERQIEKAGEQLKTLVELYRAKIEALESHKQYFRRAIEAYIRLYNDGKKVSWPDVGSAYLQKVPSKIVIGDEKGALAVLEAHGMKEAIKQVPKIIKEEFDSIYNANPTIFKNVAGETTETKELRLRRP